MARTITLKYAATCRDCGADLEAGERARYYGRGRVYGVECHDRAGNRITGSSVLGAGLADPLDDDRDPSSPVEYSDGHDFSRHDFDADPDWR